MMTCVECGSEAKDESCEECGAALCDTCYAAGELCTKCSEVGEDDDNMDGFDEDEEYDDDEID